MRRLVWVGSAVLASAAVAVFITFAPRSVTAGSSARSIPNGSGQTVFQVTDQGGRLITWSGMTLLADGRWWADGIRLRFHGDGSLHMEDHFMRGEREGICRTYDSEGHLVDEREFAHSLAVGLEKHYDSSGNLELVRRYEHGVEACSPLVRSAGDPPISDEQIACLTTEPVCLK
jgi:hypothetical protein